MLKNAVECVSDVLKEWSISTSTTGTQTIRGYAVDKFAEYEDLEEQGKLLKLPCAVGDTAWIVFEGEIFKCMVSKFDIVRNGIFPMLRINETLKTISVSMKALKKTWFLTKSEAEQALQRMNEMEEK